METNNTAFHVGDKVKMRSNRLHRFSPEFYPDDKTVGEIIMLGVKMIFVDWGEKSGVSTDALGNYTWWIHKDSIVKVEEEL